MPKHSRRKVRKTPFRIGMAITVALIAVPVALPAFIVGMRAPDTAEVTRRENRSQIRMDRRRYFDAIRKYQDLRRMGIHVPQPNVNDPATIDAILEGEWDLDPQELREARERGEEESSQSSTSAQSSISSAEMASEAASDEENGISVEDRRLLRSYIRAKSCPENLRNSAFVGFYELCRSLAGEDVERTLPRGILNDLAVRKRKHAAAPPSMRLRMRTIDEAHDPSTRRPNTPGPGRPTKYRGLEAE